MLIRLLDATPFLAVGLFFLYEAVSIIFQLSPTISRILAYDLYNHPPVITFVWGMGIGAFIVMLALHITGFLPFWRP